MAETVKRGRPCSGFRLESGDLLSRVSPSVRELLQRAEAGESYAKLAEAFGVPVGTVKSRLSRARARFLAARVRIVEPS